MRTPGLVVVAVLTIVTTLGACGSDDDRLSSEEFLDQGNAICETSNAASAEAGASFAGREPTPEELVSYFEVIAPTAQGVIDDLGALNPPEDMQASVDEFLADAQTALDEVVATSSPEPFTEVYAQAVELGLTACGGNAESG